MSVGLIALLDDVAALAKVAAASLDDIAGQATKAGAKAAGVVIDDAAVTPRYVTGFSASRELPIIWRITLGSLRNKLVFLLPLALAIAYLAPGAMTPLLMLGGLYLCYEGAEKVFEALAPQEAHGHEASLECLSLDAETFEDKKIASAIKTDFILSAEIMAITLAAIPGGTLWERGLVLALVGVGITAAVYGTVAVLVKADDLGLALARRGDASGNDLVRALGRGLVRVMPAVFTLLGIVGTAAMIWVGGGILVHGLEALGWPEAAHLVEGAAHWSAARVSAAPALAGWLASAGASGIIGLGVGGLTIPLASHVVAPLWRRAKHLLVRGKTA